MVEKEMEAVARLVLAGVVAGVVAMVRDPTTAWLAMKVLLLVLLEEGNREAGATASAVEAIVASAPAERLLELVALVLARAVEGMARRNQECAIGVLVAISMAAEGRESRRGSIATATIGGQDRRGCDVG
jgi:hypothetical protein